MSGAATGVTEGCITDYPTTIVVGYGPGNGWLMDAFNGGTDVQGGDSGSLWFDNDRRVHGLLVARAGNGKGWFGRWQHVANGWNARIATQ